MKGFLVIFAAIVATQAAVPWDAGFRVRFDLNPLGIGTTSFLKFPRTVSEAKNGRWVETQRPEGPLPSLVMFCPSNTDRTVCCMYDDTEYLAGLQIALPTDAYVSTSGFDMETLGFSLWTPPVSSGSLITYWASQQYYVDEAFLDISAEERIATRNANKTIQGANVWVTGFNGKRIAIPTNRQELADTAKSNFIIQKCFPLMGRHFFYNMTTELPCDANSVLHWFALVHSDELVGVGLYLLGKLDSNSIPRDYLERPTKQGAELILATEPQCLDDLVDTSGLLVMHSYFVDTPWLIDCEGQ